MSSASLKAKPRQRKAKAFEEEKLSKTIVENKEKGPKLAFGKQLIGTPLKMRGSRSEAGCSFPSLLTLHPSEKKANEHKLKRSGLHGK